MKLYELVEKVYFEMNGENIPCWLDVETEEIKIRFGHRYQGQMIGFGGMNGRINDVPAYLGGVEVKAWTIEDSIAGKNTLKITL